MPEPEYQIFQTESEFDAKEAAICGLFSLPNRYKTTEYHEKIKHYSQNLWCGTVENRLVQECANMTPSARLVYYDSEKLVTVDYLTQNGWWPPNP